MTHEEFESNEIYQLIFDNQTEDKCEELLKLIKNGADLSIIDEDDKTFIHHIVESITFERLDKEYCDSNLYAIIEIISSHVPNLIHRKDRFGMSAIAKAIEAENVELANLLFKLGANPNELVGKRISSYDPLNLLFHSLEKQNTDMVHLLLKQKNLQVNIFKNYKKDPEYIFELLNQVQGDYILLSKYRKILNVIDESLKENFLRNLVEKNQYSKINDSSLKTFISTTLSKILEDHVDKSESESYRKIDRFLYKYRDSCQIIINIIDNDNISKDDKTSQILKFLSNNDDIWLNIQNIDKETILSLAIKKSYIELAYKLIELGANVNVIICCVVSETVYYDTIICYVASRGNVHLLKELILAGANFYDLKGSSSLMMYAISSRKIEVVQALIEAKMNINSKNEFGNTPLHFCVMKKDTTMFKELLLAGADINATNKKGETVFNCYAIWEHLSLLNPNKNFKNLFNVVKDIRNKLNHQTTTMITEAFKRYLEEAKTKNSEDAFNNLLKSPIYSKCIGISKIHQKIFETQAELLDNDLGVYDTIKSFFKNKAEIKIDKAVSSIVKDITKYQFYKKSFSERLKYEIIKSESKEISNNR